jgi:site-specific recombinase XerD
VLAHRADQHRNRALLTLLYRSGLRVSGTLSLRPADVDLTRHSIRLLDTKSGKPQTCGFHPPLMTRSQLRNSPHQA